MRGCGCCGRPSTAWPRPRCRTLCLPSGSSPASLAGPVPRVTPRSARCAAGHGVTSPSCFVPSSGKRPSCPRPRLRQRVVGFPPSARRTPGLSHRPSSRASVSAVFLRVCRRPYFLLSLARCSVTVLFNISVHCASYSDGLDVRLQFPSFPCCFRTQVHRSTSELPTALSPPPRSGTENAPALGTCPVGDRLHPLGSSTC